MPTAGTCGGRLSPHMCYPARFWLSVLLNQELLHIKKYSFFFPFIFINWRLITLLYCSGFCHTLTWISHGFTCVPILNPPSHLPPHPIPLGHPTVSALSTCLLHPTWTGDLFHLGWTGWITLQSKGLSRVFSNTTFQKYQFFGAQLSLQSNSHIHTWLLEKP